MLFAIPCVKEELCMHFGHCEQFAFIEVDEKEKGISKVTMHTPPPHEPGLLPRWLRERGVNLVIAGGMGMRAKDIFAQHNIEVITGATSGSPEQLVMNYINGTLETGENVCDH
jgi:ATP-binding protein involved in chromosome partitioning